MDQEAHRLAALIDAENAQLAILPELLAEVAKIGSATVKRVYGDFTTPALASWRDPLLAHSIQPVQQFRNTVHKNARDSALIIDAMDLLYSGRLEGYCIVSGDSDFTRLASRIREEGLRVYGFGERETPTIVQVIAACEKFVYTEVLRNPGEGPQLVGHTSTEIGARIRQQLVDAAESCADEDGWAQLGALGNVIANHVPDFDPRHYGFKKLSMLVEASGLFDMKRQGDESSSSFLVKLKSAATAPTDNAAFQSTGMSK
jgi:hypothetical protein